MSYFDHISAQCGKYLASVAKSAETRRPGATGKFRAVILGFGD